MVHNEHIKQCALELGFDLCGLARCRHLADNEAWFRYWLEHGYQSSLAYMEQNCDKRFDPRKLVEDAQTVVVCAVSYKNRFSGTYPHDYPTKIASYALNRDYHKILKKMLKQLMFRLQEDYPQLEGRMFVDTAPLAEKQLAVEAGLGWIGRQSLVVNPTFGTYILLGELVLCEAADHYDRPITGAQCGKCHRCVDSCPNHAILCERMIDTNRCISCHTIEQEPSTQVDLHGWIFGCEECQVCCPYNRKAPLHTNPNFDPRIDPMTLNRDAWLAMDEAQFEAQFQGTPLMRSGLQRIQKNLKR